MSTEVTGIHHVTAIAGEPQRNVDFYAGLLGLRMVKKTVNFDDPGTYHLYYGDGTGTPGSIMTFFPWAGAPNGRIGAGQLTVTSFSFPAASLGYWTERLVEAGVRFEKPEERFGETVLRFSDPDGLRLELVAAGEDGREGWAEGPVPAEHAVRGFHHVTLAVTDPPRTSKLMTDALGFRQTGEAEGRTRYEAGEGGPGNTVDVADGSGFPLGTMGVGTVHHVAFRVSDEERQLELREEIAALAYNVTPVLDRNYFRSIYFREPGGVLFEIATDPPGFAVDEEPEHLGEDLKLPPWLESRRDQLEEVLPPLRVACAGGGKQVSERDLGFAHRFFPGESGATLLLLHGTGGDENDLVPLGRQLAPVAAILSPRGKVSEYGAARFFRRLAEGVFDHEDLVFRTHELADFIGAASEEYEFDPSKLVAVGYSNGANIAASLMLLHPGLLRAAVLFRAMVPFEPEETPDLSGMPVFLAAGRMDRMIAPENTERLAEILDQAGADLDLRWRDTGHALTYEEVAEAKEWLSGVIHKLS